MTSDTIRQKKLLPEDIIHVEVFSEDIIHVEVFSDPRVIECITKALKPGIEELLSQCIEDELSTLTTSMTSLTADYNKVNSKVDELKDLLALATADKTTLRKEIDVIKQLLMIRVN